jgi:hypothetical protein
MGLRPVVSLLAALAVSLPADPQVEAAIRALRRDSSLKVRTQAAIVLGQRGALEAVQALREAVAEDRAAAVRIAAVAALAKIGDRRARPTLRHATEADPDDAVRRAAARALAGFGPLALAIDEPAGAASVRVPLREALARHLEARRFSVQHRGDVRLKPTVKLDVDEKDGKTVIAVRTTLVVVDSDGRVEMLEASARATVSGVVPEGKVAGYSAKAIDAAARTLCDDLAAKLAER